MKRALTGTALLDNVAKGSIMKQIRLERRTSNKNTDGITFVVYVTVDGIITKAGEILDSINYANAVADFAKNRTLTVVLEEESQIEYICVLGLIGLEFLRSHVIICGNPSQISRVVKHDT